MARVRLTVWQQAGSALLLALACAQGVRAQDASPPAMLTVGAGDTATALALQLRPEGATLEQTLVALWRSNPRAFGNGNLNQLLQGATLKVPGAQDILRIPAVQAHALVVEQVEHFQAYARQQGKPLAAASTAASAGPDPSQWARALAEAQALKEALERQNRDTQDRLAQLERNIQTLQGLQPGASAPPAEASEASEAASPSSTPAITASQATSVPPAQSSATVLPSVQSVPLEALWGGVLLVFGLIWLITRRRSPSPVSDAAAPLEIPPQMARISLDLDGPSSGPAEKQDTRP